jgi:hypothetical protein
MQEFFMAKKFSNKQNPSARLSRQTGSDIFHKYQKITRQL